MRAKVKVAITHTAGKLALFALIMFGFGYALVPLYDVFCDLTGLNGRTGRISAQVANELTIDHTRQVTVEFDANVNSRLSWQFKPLQRKLRVHPGEIAEAVFLVKNTAATEITGQAIPSVAPTQAALYFDKSECFCFSNQTLSAGEQQEMVVRFVVDPALPAKVNVLTLSYTFFAVPAA